MMAATLRAPEPGGQGELERATLMRCKSGDPMAFRAFVVRYQRPVFALLSRFLGHGEHVSDLAQETFLRAFRALPGFDVDGAARPSTWLLTIATRLALDKKRKKQVPEVPLDEWHVPSDGDTPERQAERAELGRAIARAAQALPDEQRAAFVLAEFHGLAIAEIAEALSLPDNTVKTRLFRARQKLREALSEHHEGMAAEEKG